MKRHNAEKLTAEQVYTIRTSGRKTADLAAEYGVSIQCIRHCARFITYWDYHPTQPEVHALLEEQQARQVALDNAA